ncbi:HesB/IscA family protein [Thiolapillus brandeum]|uniref:Iron-sulfur cluster assembly accessory protein n=1 Tax=Thiolapillus brandeum TaxID=1076588 RepID=A0A7U6GIA9_9GAMM|nr:iron-sulfur cluster assembly accessory protein [Thiolapillus brandeum]BAO44161.1 iron-sulfur cluster assembly accessory protein [Thiolapillus brandeum]
MSVQLTDNAAAHVKKMLANQPDAIGLRLGTKAAGCTGFAYVVDYAHAIGEDDQVFDSHGIRILVDAESLPRIDGLVVDFVKNNLLNEGFEFHNPNVTDTCGCGESFAV